MSQHGDEAPTTTTTAASPASSESFWEPGNYKWTTKRIEDGNKMCNEYVTLLKERAEIEKSYAKSLRGWAKKWEDAFDRGPEYGTTQESWKGAATEANKIADLHTTVRDRIHDEVCLKISLWQKDNYHKSMMQLKEKKEMDDRFRKEQKPWEKLYIKVHKARSDYHNACKAEKTALNNKLNATRDSSSLSPEAAKKVDERVDKAREAVSRARLAYEASLREISDFNPVYRESMSKVFDICQEVEAVRLRFVKEVLFAVHDCLNISAYPELPEIYEDFRRTIHTMDQDKDLRWWSANRGVNMPMNWPKFEEYTEEFRDISTKKKSAAVADSTIMLINQRSFGDELPEASSDFDSMSSATGKKALQATSSSSFDGTSSLSKKKSKNKGGGGGSDDQVSKQKRFGSNPLLDSNKKSSKKDSSSSHSGSGSKRIEIVSTSASKRTNGHGNGTLYEDEEWDENPADQIVDNGQIGIPVKALYDYDGAEQDELSFRTGEVFEKLEDEDEQGWCKGRKSGKIGLYPANYVTLL